VQQPSAQCGDLLLRDRFGQWTYQYAVVVDDLRQAIDVIIRGDDLLASTARQRMLAEALGASKLPHLLHHPLIMHPDGTKLSKSRGDTGLRELRSAGWSPEQVLGHAAWLGGLQREPAPLPAANLARLWSEPDFDA
jgi:glutamyl-tRNA synthetase/glutamyl-Q tRNA(Asp) synthetase